MAHLKNPAYMISILCYLKKTKLIIWQLKNLVSNLWFLQLKYQTDNLFSEGVQMISYSEKFYLFKISVSFVVVNNLKIVSEWSNNFIILNIIFYKVIKIHSRSLKKSQYFD